MKMKTQVALLSTAIFSASLIAPMGAAAATFQIDEGNFQIPLNQVLYAEANTIGINAFGFDPATLNIHSTNETITGFMVGDAHAEWIALNPFGNGVSQVFNFNVFEPANEGGNSVLSDTLSITLTGQTPTTSDANNMSLDLHFRSGNLSDNPVLPPLSGGISLGENGVFQLVDPFLPAQLVDDPINPLSVGFRSDVIPEPGMWQIGLLGVLMPFVLRRWRAKS
jgi:hypothetical protein